MRAIPAALQAKLDSGITTLCRCWIVRRRDGLVQGFTDHDEDIVLDATACLAGTGLTGSEAVDRLGLQVDGAEISGALAADSLNEADLAAGRYDAAQVEVWLVDWSQPALRVMLASGVLGEVRREGASFSAELRSLADRLNQESGRLYTQRCSADLGDARCTVDLAAAPFRGTGTVAALVGSSAFTATGLDAFVDGWFAAGRLVFSTGANSGVAVEIKSHRVQSGHVMLSLWQAMPEPITPGDVFAISAGCDKAFATCRDRFANSANFRGFPHIPGNDFVLSYPARGQGGNDGRALR